MDPADSYEENLKIETEPETSLPENTADEINKKMSALERKRDLLKEAADYDIPPPGPNPLAMVVPLKDKYSRTETMPETKFDSWLRRKQARMQRDIDRLKERKEQFNAIKTAINKEAQANTSADGYFLSRSTVRSAEEYLRKNRRRKKAGLSGKTGSTTSRARKKT